MSEPKVPELPKNLLDLGAHKVGQAPWSPAAASTLADLRKRQAAAPKSNVPSGKGRRTRRHRRARKSKYTRRR